MKVKISSTFSYGTLEDAYIRGSIHGAVIGIANKNHTDPFLINLEIYHDHVIVETENEKFIERLQEFLVDRFNLGIKFERMDGVFGLNNFAIN